jgi:hypothetical protein
LIFEADPKQIKDLDSKELVQLMHRLLLAESRLAQIPLRSSHTALQITISDGGEDGRVEWEGGVESPSPSMGFGKACLSQRIVFEGGNSS